MIGEAPGQEQVQSIPKQVDMVQVQRRLDDGGMADFIDKRRLTRREKAVLDVITDSALTQATNEEKAKAAGVSISRFYEIMRDAWFQSLHREHGRALVTSRVHRYLDAADETAIKVGRDGFNDRRMLLEISGHYTPRQQIDHTTAGQPIVGVVGIDPGEL